METWDLSIEKLEPVQVACLAIDPKTLNVIPGSEFCSLMRPLDMTNFNQRAIDVNGLTPDKVKDAPTQEAVWRLFAEHVKKYRTKGGLMGRPIACGKNIENFDLPIVQRLCTTYSMVDKDGKQNLFNARTRVDLEELVWPWFSGTDGEIANYKMDTLRDYFGQDKALTHDALTDTRQTADLIVRFLRLHRNLFARVGFKGSCKKKEVAA